MSSIPSPIAMKEKHRRSPRVPPNPAMKEDKPYNSSSISTSVKGDVCKYASETLGKDGKQD